MALRSVDRRPPTRRRPARVVPLAAKGIVLAVPAFGLAAVAWLFLAPEPVPAPASQSVGEPRLPVPSRVESGTFLETQVELGGPRLLLSDGVSGDQAADLAQARRVALLCQVCGKGTPRGVRFMESSGDRWHKRCFETRPKCGISGRPIPDEVARVELEGISFHLDDYARAPKAEEEWTSGTSQDVDR